MLVAVSLTVTLQLAGATETSAAIGIGSRPVANTTALDSEGGAGNWSALVAIVFLAVANLVSLARRRPMLRPDEPPLPTPWDRLVAARY